MSERDKQGLDALRDEIGKELGVSRWIEVDQARIDRFADATQDHQWIHVDTARAVQESPFGGTIAHGFLSLSLVSAALGEIVASRYAIREAFNYGLDKVRFIAPVRAGKRVRTRVKVNDVQARNGGLLLATENTVEIEGEDKPALIAQSLVLLM